jgi:serine/threonine-protein kinase RsbW
MGMAAHRKQSRPVAYPGEPVDLEIPPSSVHLAALRRAARGALGGLSEDAVADVLLALDEAVSNAIRHGSRGGRPIRVGVAVRDGWIEISVQDYGPTPRVPPLPDDPPAPLAPGGRGLWLILQVADEVRLTRVGEGTRLSLRRRAEARDGTPPGRARSRATGGRVLPWTAVPRC